SNKKVATVSSSGKVTGKKKGTAKIIVTMQIKDGAKKTATTKVTVK
ncbi:MAG: Ig-like domain-containing protein, partial [Lachnospiraceae bacterium]|nr:Ig-like domain-containing protein [Lachnospiraceae bacterium]